MRSEFAPSFHEKKKVMFNQFVYCKYNLNSILNF